MLFTGIYIGAMLLYPQPLLLLLHVFYRCYVFLCACGNGKLLLQCALLEAQTLNAPETLAVLSALKTFAEKHQYAR